MPARISFFHKGFGFSFNLKTIAKIIIPAAILAWGTYLTINPTKAAVSDWNVDFGDYTLGTCNGQNDWTCPATAAQIVNTAFVGQKTLQITEASNTATYDPGSKMSDIADNFLISGKWSETDASDEGRFLFQDSSNSTVFLVEFSGSTSNGFGGFTNSIDVIGKGVDSGNTEITTIVSHDVGSYRLMIEYRAGGTEFRVSEEFGTRTNWLEGYSCGGDCIPKRLVASRVGSPTGPMKLNILSIVANTDFFDPDILPLGSDLDPLFNPDGAPSFPAIINGYPSHDEIYGACDDLLSLSCLLSWVKYFFIPETQEMRGLLTTPMQGLLQAWPFSYISVPVDAIVDGFQTGTCPFSENIFGQTYGSYTIPSFDPCDTLDDANFDGIFAARPVVETLVVSTIYLALGLGLWKMAASFLTAT